MYQLLIKMLKNATYESLKGGLVVGGAVINWVDADVMTIVYLTLAGVLFNFLKEILQQKSANG